MFLLVHGNTSLETRSLIITNIASPQRNETDLLTKTPVSVQKTSLELESRLAWHLQDGMGCRVNVAMTAVMGHTLPWVSHRAAGWAHRTPVSSTDYHLKWHGIKHFSLLAILFTSKLFLEMSNSYFELVLSLEYLHSSGVAKPLAEKSGQLWVQDTAKKKPSDSEGADRAWLCHGRGLLRHVGATKWRSAGAAKDFEDSVCNHSWMTVGCV